MINKKVCTQRNTGPPALAFAIHTPASANFRSGSLNDGFFKNDKYPGRQGASLTTD
jgi:hypothetical protein